MFIQPNIETQSQTKRINSALEAGPILKWAGGKTQLLPTISKYYPDELLEGELKTYIEPFVGGGSVFFDLFNRGLLQKAYLIDTNPDLIQLYKTIKKDVGSLVKVLEKLENQYLATTPDKQEEMFYKIREDFNSAKADEASVNADRAALTIFLNRTCFNGLFRVNSRGNFNVPFGRHSNPTILFKDKLLAASKAFEIAELIFGDFEQTLKFANDRTFVYFDPPYRPISQTSHFKSYSKDSFNDDAQRRLARLFKGLSDNGVKVLLSNSDPTNHGEDSFFDDLYADFEILRVTAKRMINSKGTGRGAIKELLIKNYV